MVGANRSLYLPDYGTCVLEASLLNREKEKTNTQNPLIHTQQAPPLPLTESTANPCPHPSHSHPEPWDRSPRPRSEGCLKIPSGSSGLAPPTSANASGNCRASCHGDTDQGSFHCKGPLRRRAPNCSAPRPRPAWWRHEDGSQWNEALRKQAWVWISWLNLNRREADNEVKRLRNLSWAWGELKAREENSRLGDVFSDEPSSRKRRGPAASGIEDQVGLLTNTEALGGAVGVRTGVGLVRVPVEKVKGRRNSRTH